MKLLLMRHGESRHQAKQIDLTAPDSENGLTNTGIKQVEDTAHCFRGKISAIYVSPYNRTILTAQTFLNGIKMFLPINIDNRLREIDYGKFIAETKNTPEMIAVATKQIAGDYEVRFGDTGENKREIVTRFFEFLVDVFNEHNTTADSVLAVTHGRAISIIISEFCMINNLPVIHTGTKNAQIKEIELTPERIYNVIQHIKKINSK